MVRQARPRFAFEDYLRLEEGSPIKHEFYEGQVWAMAGGTPEHAGIAANVVALLRTSLRGKPCRVFTSDLRIRVAETGLATYPDATVVCGKLELDPQDKGGTTVQNPRLLVEVLSPSTEDYDRGEKLAQYKLIGSVDEILLISHDEKRLELWRRDGSRWTLEMAKGTESLRLMSIDATVSVSEVYEDPLSA